MHLSTQQSSRMLTKTADTSFIIHFLNRSLDVSHMTSPSSTPPPGTALHQLKRAVYAGCVSTSAAFMSSMKTAPLERARIILQCQAESTIISSPYTSTIGMSGVRTCVSVHVLDCLDWLRVLFLASNSCC